MPVKKSTTHPTPDNIPASDVQRAVQRMTRAQKRYDERYRAATRELSSRLCVLTDHVNDLCKGHNQLVHEEATLDQRVHKLATAICHVENRFEADSDTPRLGLTAVQDVVTETMSALDPYLLTESLQFLTEVGDWVESTRQGLANRIAGLNNGQDESQALGINEETSSFSSSTAGSGPISWSNPFTVNCVAPLFPVCELELGSRDCPSAWAPTPPPTPTNSPDLAFQNSNQVAYDQLIDPGFGNPEFGKWVTVDLVPACNEDFALDEMEF